MTAKQFLKLKKRNERHIEKLEKEIEDAREQVTMPPRAKLRPAHERDIVEGNVIYYHVDEPENAYWQIIDEVRYPGDSFKAYVAEDGCRYGLDGAFVEG